MYYYYNYRPPSLSQGCYARRYNIYSWPVLVSFCMYFSLAKCLPIYTYAGQLVYQSPLKKQLLQYCHMHLITKSQSLLQLCRLLIIIQYMNREIATVTITEQRCKTLHYCTMNVCSSKHSNVNIILGLIFSMSSKQDWLASSPGSSFFFQYKLLQSRLHNDISVI